MHSLKRLPRGKTSFEEIIDGNYIYVDKTYELSNIIDETGPYFLSRPRRFGKSTLIDTLDCLFSGKKDLFTNTYIGKNKLFPDKEYMILRIDFSSFKNRDKDFAKSFKAEIQDLLNNAKLHLELNEDFSLGQVFSKAVSHAQKSSLVLLIDEYDAPLTEVLNDSKELNKRREILANFYSNVKACVDYFKFIFITGVTKYSHVSIFSAFNNLVDLSLDPDFGSIVGYTQDELETNFREHIENAAIALNKEENTDKYTYQIILDALKQNYDGYSFDEKCKHHVYNPWSILNFLKSPKRGFQPYWADTGGAKPSLLVKYLNSIDSVSNVKNFEKFLNLNYQHNISKDSLSPTLESIDSKNFGLLPILYQAGYFCIKGINEDSSFKIGIPNNEVKQSIADIVIESLIKKIPNNNFYEIFKHSFINNLAQKNTNAVKEALNKIINSLSYDGISKFNEASYRDFIATVLMFAGAKNIINERVNAQGRCDLTFETLNYAYVIEFKLAHKKEEINSLLSKAKEQIKAKRYDVLLTNKEVISYVFVILHQNNSDQECSIHEIADIQLVD